MKIYNALIKKNKEGKIEDVKLLKEGFSWMAFLFSIFWFLYHKMWKESFAIFIISIVFTILEIKRVLHPQDLILLDILFSFIIAVNANYWLLDSLKKRGYAFSGLVFGSSLANAKMRFIKNLEVEGKLSGEKNQDIVEFDDSILNPKIHRKLLKLKKHTQYFTV